MKKILHSFWSLCRPCQLQYPGMLAPVESLWCVSDHLISPNPYTQWFAKEHSGFLPGILHTDTERKSLPSFTGIFKLKELVAMPHSSVPTSPTSSTFPNTKKEENQSNRKKYKKQRERGRGGRDRDLDMESSRYRDNIWVPGVLGASSIP